MSRQINIRDIKGQLALQPSIVAPYGYSLWAMSNYSVTRVSELDYLCSTLSLPRDNSSPRS